MSFYPEMGLWSQESFSNADGAIFTDSTLQYITGGYVTLLPQVVAGTSFISAWHNPTGWTYTNGLYSKSLITGSLSLHEGPAIEGNIATQSGYSHSIASAGAWEIFTDVIVSGSGQITECIASWSGAPNTQWYNYFNSIGVAATIEVDVASIYDLYSGQNILQGFVTGQQNLTSLPPLTGIIGHGIYINSIGSWDFIEVTPYGIRSMNHPELAIPIDLGSPKRIRIGIDETDIYLATEDGKSIAGLGLFDTPGDIISYDCAVVLGAPPITTNSGLRLPMANYGISGFVGNTLWSNFKLTTGEMLIQSPSGLIQHYSQAPVTMYTAPFDPKIGINNFVSATIGFKESVGGDTSITAQYYTNTGWSDFGTYNLSGLESPYAMNLTDLPVRSYPTVDLGQTGVNNPLRFKIIQSSTLGNTLPPSVDFIKVIASKERAYLNVTPNWKLKTHPTNVQLGVQTGTFIYADPAADLWTSVLINIPTGARIVDQTYSFTESSKSGRPITIKGTGEFVLDGPYGYSYKNYTNRSGQAQLNSDAWDIFGSDVLYNYFPNPLFDDNFRSILSESNYYTGHTDGVLAEHLYIPSIYTGQGRVYYSQEQVYRPENQATVERINQYLGRSTLPLTEYVQGVYSPIGPHDGTVGIEARIPSGIAYGPMIASFDLQVIEGTGISFYVSGQGTTLQKWSLPGAQLRNYRQLSFPITSTNSGELWLGFTVPSGANSGDPVRYNIDNLTVSPISQGYLSCNNIPIYYHQSGVVTDSVAGLSTFPPIRNNTVFYTSLYLDSYPSATGIVFKAYGTNYSGLEINIDQSGYLGASVDMGSSSWARNDSNLPFTETYSREKFKSVEPVPLGRWTNVGFIHQAWTADKLGYAHYSGETAPAQLAMSNRIYMTIDGYPVFSRDMMSGWKSHTGISGESAPWASYVYFTGNVTSIIASGIYCKIDGVHLQTPPVADAEVELSIRGARVSAPYFIPDSLYKGVVNDQVSNSLCNTGNDTTYGSDIYLASCYNFCSPGYTHWDHGPLKNHLMFSGTVLKEYDTPFTGYDLHSTRFPVGAYATARYSSSMERLLSISGQIDMKTGSPVGSDGRIKAMGWMYPRTTGTFFSIYHDENNTASPRIDLELNTAQCLQVTKWRNATSPIFTLTGSYLPLSGWHYVSFDYTIGSSTKYHIAATDTSAVKVRLDDESGSYSFDATGQYYGLKYQGRVGGTPSALHFGKEMDVSLFNWAITLPPTGDINYTSNGTTQFSGEGDKGGRAQLLLDGSQPFTGSVYWTGFYNGLAKIPQYSGDGNSRSLWASLFSAYDNTPKLNGGILLYNKEPFIEADSYYIKYDTSLLEQTFGATDSPIKLGYQVPPGGINIAKISSPGYTVAGAINTLDLSDRNVNNLITYNNGTYTSERNGGDVTTTIANGVSSILLGRADVVLSGGSQSKSVDITSMSVTSIDLSVPKEAYYYYLVGRGDYGIKISDAYPHPTGNLTAYSTGVDIDKYISNIEKVKNSIVIKNRKGEILDSTAYPYDIIVSQYSPDLLESYSYSGYDINIDGIGGISGSYLPNGVFSVMLITPNRMYSSSDSAWIYYNSYKYSSDSIDPSHREVIIPMPIMRENLSFETPEAGRYQIKENAIDPSVFNLTIFGIASGYSGKL